jgi:ketosteroid isomerase-like protein
MSRDRVEIVRTLIERWNAGDRRAESLPEYFDPAVELESPLSSVVGEPYRGYAGVEHWMRDLEEHFAEWRIGVDEVRQTGNQVIAIVTINARGRASDIDLQFRSASVHHFGADHRLTRIRIYPDVNEALAAVGLEA